MRLGQPRSTGPGLGPWGAALAAALVLALSGPATAQAQQRVVAGPAPITYSTTSVTIDQGDSLGFLNLDVTAVHDVASADRANGSFLFKSEVIPAPGEVPVEGVERLRAGSYGFFCTVHPWMTGTLEVRGGDPEPDTTGPEAAVRILEKRIRRVLKRDRLRTRVTIDRPARVRLNATAGRGDQRQRIARGRGALDEAGSTRIAAKLTRAGKRLLRRSNRRGKRVRVTVSARATDEAGNTSTARASKRLR